MKNAGAIPYQNEPFYKQLRHFLSNIRLSMLQGFPFEAALVLLSFATLTGGYLLERSEAPFYATTAVFALSYISGGYAGFWASLEAIRERTIDVDLLMILAAIGAAIVGEPFEGALLLFLFSLSNLLQNIALDRTNSAIKSLIQLRPTTAAILRGKQFVTMNIEQAQIGDLMRVKPGERIPLDGVVHSGNSSVDQAALTGESMPVGKAPGDTVLAGSINKNGSLEVTISKRAADSTLARLIKLVEEAQSQKANTESFIDRAEGVYAKGIILFTILVIAVPLLFGWDNFSDAFYRGMTVLVAASPCALVISTPATVLSAIGNGARRGILFKGGTYVENAATIKVVAFDKTGTLTEGRPQITDVRPVASTHWQGSEDDLLALAAAVEARSEHLLAQATVAAADAKQLDIADALAFEATTGKGVQARVNGQMIQIGNVRHFAEIEISGRETAVAIAAELQDAGKTAVLVAKMLDDSGGKAAILGVIGFADLLRPEAATVVQEIKAAGVDRVVMLTGDHEKVAHSIAAQTGLDAIYADLMPEDKSRIVQELMATHGSVAMVGDGVNDAPALATASLGIAMGAAGTDVALETADIVLMSDNLQNIPYLLGLSRQTRKTLAINLGFAMFMILLMIGAIFISGLALPTAVIGHEGGTVLVSLNGLRMLGYKPRDG